MANEEGGAAVVTETPGGSTGGSANTTSTGSTQASSQPAVKWEDTPQYRGQVAELQKERKARQDFERRIQETNARLEERDRQVAALTNTRTPSREESDEQAIKDRFKQLFPHLADLTAEDVEAIREAKGQGAQTTQFIEQQWTNHHKGLVDQVHADIAKELGELSPRQIKRINAAYVVEAEQNPEFLDRISRGDKTAVAQFVKEYIEDLVEPIRRKQNAADASRFRTVPNAKDRSVPMAGEKRIDPTDNDAVMKMLVASRKGQFGR